MISRVMKSHTKEHTGRGRPTPKDVEHFWNWSVCKPYERSIYKQTFWVNLSRIMLYQTSYQLGLSTLQLDKNHLQKHHHVFRCDREPRRIPAWTQECLSNKSKSTLQGKNTKINHITDVLWANNYPSCVISNILIGNFPNHPHTPSPHLKNWFACFLNGLHLKRNLTVLQNIQVVNKPFKTLQ